MKIWSVCKSLRASVPAAASPWLLGAASCFLLLNPARAGAASQRTVLVLSISDEGRQQDGLRAQVSELVQRVGAQVVDAGSLPSSARACDEPGCLGKLAEEHRAELVLAARITRRNRHERFVDMWIYDISHGREQTGQELCDSRDMKDCLTGLAGRLLGPQLDGSVPSETAEPPPGPARATSTAEGTSDAAVRLVPPPLSSRSRPERAGRLPLWRIGLGGGLGALAVGSLVTAIVATAMHGSAGSEGACTPEGSQMGCRYDLTRVFAPSYAVAGVFAVGSVLSFTLPGARAPRKETR